MTRPRPWTIVDFERIMLGSLAASLVVTWFYWDAITGAGTESPRSTGFTILTLLLSYGITVGLTLLISRRRSRIAKWVAIVLFVLGLPMVFGIVVNGLSPVPPVITLLQTFVQFVAYGLLFTPSARHWMKRDPEISPEIFS